jgi:ATP-dependent RNA helicase DeaD
MEQFREGHINILVATDLAARGIDVKEYPMVFICLTFMAYVHRSGKRLPTGDFP